MKFFLPLVIVSFGCLVFLASSVDFSALSSKGAGGLKADSATADLASNQSESQLQDSFMNPGERHSDGPRLVLMKFGAPWCPPCRKIDHELHKLEKSSLPVEIRKIDVDEQPELAERYGVSSIPRLILLQDGRKVGDLVGYHSSEELAEWISDEASEAALAAKKRTAMPSVVQSNPFFQ